MKWFDQNNIVTTALEGFIAVVLVALIGVFAHGRQARATARSTQTADAYSQYVAAVAHLAAANHQRALADAAAAKEDHQGALADVAVAKGWIAIYGNAATLEATSKVTGTTTETEINEFLGAIDAMRKHVGADDRGVKPQHLRALLFD